jgi:hypothetical protein
MKKLKYIAPILIAVACFGFQQAQATTLDLQNSMHWTTNDSYLIGTVIPGAKDPPGQAARDAAMANTLLGMATPSQTGTWLDKDNPLYSRTTWPGGGPAATGVNAVLSGSISGGGLTLTITLTQTFRYLVVTYDGQNAGTAVFDVSSLQVGDQIVLSRYAYPDADNHGDLLQDDGQYLMTHWTLLNPTSVPDGGATVMLLGVALGAVGLVRRFIMS